MSERRTVVLRRQIMRYICEYYESTGCMPCYRDIGAAVGLSSTSSVSRHITALRSEGLLRVSPSGHLSPMLQAAGASTEPQRFRLKLANGGEVLFDCHMELTESSPYPRLVFDGIIEAIDFSGGVSRIISCEAECE